MQLSGGVPWHRVLYIATFKRRKRQIKARETCWAQKIPKLWAVGGNAVLLAAYLVIMFLPWHVLFVFVFGSRRLFVSLEPLQGRSTVDMSHSGPVTLPTRRSESNQKGCKDTATKLLQHLSLPTTHSTLPSCCPHHSHLCLQLSIALCPCSAAAVCRYPYIFDWQFLWSLIFSRDIRISHILLRSEFMIFILLYYFLYKKTKTVLSGKWFRAWFLDLRADGTWISSMHVTPFSATP